MSTFVNIPKKIAASESPHRLRNALFGPGPHDQPQCFYQIDGDYRFIDTEQINCQILQEWMSGEFQVNKRISWRSLSDALLEIGFYDQHLASLLRSYSGPLTMNTLLNFPISNTVNILREVGVKYIQFGTHLLQDVTGAHIRTLEHELNRNGEGINYRILQEWLSGEGRPVTWATLVEVLNIIGMGELAKNIEEKYINATR